MNSRLPRWLRLVGSAASSALVLGTLAGLFYWTHAGKGTAERPQTGSAAASNQDETREVRVRRPADFQPASECPSHQLLLEFQSADAVRKLGIADEPVRQQEIEHLVTANGVIQYDQTKLAQLSPRVPGVVHEIKKQVGEEVEEGTVLALIDSIDVGRAKAEFLQSLAQVELKSKLLANLNPAIVPQRQIQEAEAGLREAQIRKFNSQQTLFNLGLEFPPDEISKLPVEQLARRVQFLGLPRDIVKDLPLTTTANLVPLKSPLKGVVIGKDIVRGEVVGTTQAHFEVADTRRMWILLEVRLEDSHFLARGQKVDFTLDGPVDQVVKDEIDWISTAADEKTRTLRVRATVRESRRQISRHTFGTGRISVRKSAKALTVPAEALQWEGNCQIVFVRLDDRRFQARKVQVEIRSGDRAEIAPGALTPTDRVVTAGAHILKAEILRTRLISGR